MAVPSAEIGHRGIAAHYMDFVVSRRCIAVPAASLGTAFSHPIHGRLMALAEYKMEVLSVGIGHRETAVRKMGFVESQRGIVVKGVNRAIASRKQF